MSEYTHQIVRIERTAAKSGAAMWRCKTADGQSVNVFQHENPDRNTIALMTEAGYANFMLMVPGEVQQWTTNPIAVTLVKDGEWWKLAAVAPREKFAEQDDIVLPDIGLHRERAQNLAKLLTNQRWQTSWLDTESTGLQEDDELISLAILTPRGHVLYRNMFEPQDASKLLRKGRDGRTASEVNGILPEQLKHQSKLEDCLHDIDMILNARVWVAYNSAFDVGLLERECIRYRQPLLYSLGVQDACGIVSEYLGHWQPQFNGFKRYKLEEAAAKLRVLPSGGQRHTAVDDVLLMIEVMRAVAQGAPVYEDVTV